MGFFDSGMAMLKNLLKALKEWGFAGEVWGGELWWSLGKVNWDVLGWSCSVWGWIGVAPFLWAYILKGI